MKNIAPIILYLVLFASCTSQRKTYVGQAKRDIPNKSNNYYGNTYQYSNTTNGSEKSPNSITPGAVQNNFESNANEAVEDTSIKVVDPSLIEKYRRARNNVVYVDLYPVDWDAINKDRGIKKPKEKKPRQSRTNFYGNNRRWLRPGFSGIGIWPMMGFGWNSNNGWSPTFGIGAGPGGFGPNTYFGWNGNRGLNYGVGFGNSFGNPFFNNGFYNNNFNNNYYPRGRRQHQAQNSYNQGFIDAINYMEQNKTSSPPSTTQGGSPSPTDSTSNKVTGIGTTKTTTNTPNITNGYEDGVGGSERYRRNVKTIDSYKVK